MRKASVTFASLTAFVVGNANRTACRKTVEKESIAGSLLIARKCARVGRRRNTGLTEKDTLQAKGEKRMIIKSKALVALQAACFFMVGVYADVINPITDPINFYFYPTILTLFLMPGIYIALHSEVIIK